MPIAVTPDMLAETRRLFDYADTPEMREAAARGRKVHEDALTLIQENPELDYQDAIEEILRGRDDG